MTTGEGQPGLGSTQLQEAFPYYSGAGSTGKELEWSKSPRKETFSHRHTQPALLDLPELPSSFGGICHQ